MTVSFPCHGGEAETIIARRWPSGTVAGASAQGLEEPFRGEDRALPHALSLASLLFVLWLLLSGHFGDPLLLGLGVASVLAVVAIAHRMDVVDHEGHPVHLSHRFALYFPWLCWEIVKANIDVAKVILSPRMPLGVATITTKGSQRSELGLVIYANSITLTPGTVTLAVEDDILTVHALTTAAADGVASGDMARRCAALEG